MSSKQFLLVCIGVVVLLATMGRSTARQLQAMPASAGDLQTGPPPGTWAPGFLTGPNEGDPLDIALAFNDNY